MRIKRIIHFILIVINQVSRIAGAISTIFLLAMMLLTVIDVFLRYAFRAPILGSVELIQYMIVIAGFPGLAWCAIKGGHVQVGVLIDRLPPRFQAIVDTITFSLVIIILPIVAWQNFVQSMDALMVKRASDILHIPTYPFYIIISFSYILLFFIMLNLLVERIRKAIKR